MSRFFPVLMFLAALVAAPAMAHADGAVLRTADLGASAPHLASLVAAARLRDPAAFDAVAQLNPHRPEQYKRWRSQNPGTAAIAFRRLGPTARFALVDLAVFHGPSQDGLEAREWQALQAGLVDAIGLAADPELAPVLRATFERSTNPALQNVAAVGLGRLGASELGTLLSHARSNDVRFVAAVRGLGMSHQPRAVAALAALLDATSSEQEAAELAGALAEAGSSWAWQTGKLGSASDEEAVRRPAAESLVRNYARFSSDAVQPLEEAVVRVAHRDTRTMISGAPASARLTHLASIIR